jgi:hypothetical protein
MPTTKSQAASNASGKQTERQSHRQAHTQSTDPDHTVTPSRHINRSPVERGNFHDNFEVLVSIKLELKTGKPDLRDLLQVLCELEEHASFSPDPKNTNLLLEIESTIEKLLLKLKCETRHLSDHPDIGAKSSSPPTSQATSTYGDYAWKDSIFRATELLIVLTFVLGLLANDIMRISPALAARPITAQIVAAAAMAFTVVGLKWLRR